MSIALRTVSPAGILVAVSNEVLHACVVCREPGEPWVTGLFVPLHFHSRERKDHRENFRSRGTFVPWNIRSRGAKSPRTFIPWNFRSCGTFERMFQELSFHGTFAPLEPSLHKQLSCPLTFAPMAYLRLLRRLVRAAVL